MAVTGYAIVFFVGVGGGVGITEEAYFCFPLASAEGFLGGFVGVWEVI